MTRGHHVIMAHVAVGEDDLVYSVPFAQVLKLGFIVNVDAVG